MPASGPPLLFSIQSHTADPAPLSKQNAARKHPAIAGNVIVCDLGLNFQSEIWRKCNLSLAFYL
jgi:hypothetical protein